ncbi:UNVERIFIED_CONTAM: hypothetical protein PYX00_003345 [Menopon gallinae]|uniref:Endoplasmic reticulum oxidoreductin-1-like protein n=1 Tax=Menopon gallinae TaxID=328185 RepID=A0AAW2I0T4_9NEOP
MAMNFIQAVSIYFYLSVLYVATAYFNKQSEPKISDSCFCQLKGQVDDCTCNVGTVDYFNNIKIYPRLQSLLTKDYFRFYKVNLKCGCPFWSDDSRCSIRFCHVEPCSEHDVPAGIKGYNENTVHHIEEAAFKYTEAAQTSDCNSDVDNELGYLNKTISKASYEEFELWKAYDDVQDNFCVINEESEDSDYVDLTLNPERYTGYKGKSAHRVWHSIYKENCFRVENSYGAYIQSSKLDGMCLEKRAFYRVISGLHASINIHLCANYLLSEKNTFGSPKGVWGPNVGEFNRRFSLESTSGEGPQWLKNLYFLYLLELRALAKASTFLERDEFYTGNDKEDEEVRDAVSDLLKVIKAFPEHFNETAMFNGGKEAQTLKEEFKQHFRNISRIMDCVGCDKCKLWGKLQIHGIGTALKILFSGRFEERNLPALSRQQFQLKRGEIVALFNSFGRLSTSIFKLEGFRNIKR